VALLRAIGFHWHAVQREVLGLGLRAADMFTPRFTASEVVSMVMASSTTSALRYEMSIGVSLTDHLLATVKGRDNRPEAPPEIGSDPVQHISADVMTIEQFEKRIRGG
jgi:hypothetical protein